MENEHSIFVERAKHAVGLDYKNPYHRHGKAFYKPYRNFYCTAKNDGVWCILMDAGYAKRSEESNGLVDYYLTREGLDWLGKTLNITIYDY